MTQTTEAEVWEHVCPECGNTWLVPLSETDNGPVFCMACGSDEVITQTVGSSDD